MGRVWKNCEAAISRHATVMIAVATSVIARHNILFCVCVALISFSVFSGDSPAVRLYPRDVDVVVVRRCRHVPKTHTMYDSTSNWEEMHPKILSKMLHCHPIPIFIFLSSSIDLRDE